MQIKIGVSRILYGPIEGCRRPNGVPEYHVVDRYLESTLLHDYVELRTVEAQSNRIFMHQVLEEVLVLRLECALTSIEHEFVD